MSNTKHEDALLKMGIGYFQEHILKMLGINYEYVEIGPTELVELTIHSLFMDFTFLTTQNVYIHIEFQTTNSSEDDDLRRFHAYEAMYSHKTGKKVITYVVYSGGITHSKTTLDCGSYTYHINPIYMAQKNADEIFERLNSKRTAGETFTEDDYAQVSLTPLMVDKVHRKNKIKEAISLIKSDSNNTADKTLAMLYTLADKFLNAEELKEIKEAIAMTRLGQMILDDGINKGEDEMAKLTKKLLEANRIEDCKKAADDKQYRILLMKEFGIR